MTTFNKNEDTRNYIDLVDILGSKAVPLPTGAKAAPEAAEKQAPPLQAPQELVLEVLERLSPGITRAILEALTQDQQLAQRVQRGALDLIDLYKMLEGADRTPVAPTARSANSVGPGAFNAHNLSDEEYAKIQRLAHNGTNVRI